MTRQDALWNFLGSYARQKTLKQFETFVKKLHVVIHAP